MKPFRTEMAAVQLLFRMGLAVGDEGWDSIEGFVANLEEERQDKGYWGTQGYTFVRILGKEIKEQRYRDWNNANPTARYPIYSNISGSMAINAFQTQQYFPYRQNFHHTYLFATLVHDYLLPSQSLSIHLWFLPNNGMQAILGVCVCLCLY